MNHARRLIFDGHICRVASKAYYDQSCTEYHIVEYGAKTFERNFNRKEVMLISKSEFEERFVLLYKERHNVEYTGQTTYEITDRLKETGKVIDQQILLEFDNLVEQLRDALNGVEPAAGNVPIVDLCRVALSCLSSHRQTPDIMPGQNNRSRQARRATVNMINRSTPENWEMNASGHFHRGSVQKSRSHLKHAQGVTKSSALGRRRSERIAERLEASKSESIERGHG